MKKHIKLLLIILLDTAGALLALYVGGYYMFLRSLRILVTRLAKGTLSQRALILCVTKIFFAATAGGGIWCIFDIIAGIFRDHGENEEIKLPEFHFSSLGKTSSEKTLAETAAEKNSEETASEKTSEKKEETP